jgi:hypothetical protein
MIFIEAIGIFTLNIEECPDVLITYNILGEAELINWF